MKDSALKANREKVAAWQHRSRATALARKRQPVGPLTPSEWREAVWHACEGRCVATGVSVRLHGPSYEWSAHHPLPKQHLPSGWRYDPRNGIVLSDVAHRRHEARQTVIPFEELPVSCMEFAEELDELNLLAASAVERLLRCHPPTSKGGP